MEAKQDLKISGAGSAGGGIYDEVKISGSGNINGDLECNTLKCSGSADIEGNVAAKNIKFSGSAKIRGNIKAETMDVSGSVKVNGNMDTDEIKVSGGSQIIGDVKTKKIKISGTSSIDGNLHGEEIDISGSINIKKDCESEIFKASGSMNIEGLLNAGEINIALHGRCRAKEIGGENISVRLSAFGDSIVAKFLKSMFSYRRELITEAIEGDNIYLEGTTAKIVRGNNVAIGKGCYIEIVEYSGEIKIVDDGKVEKKVKI
ncbi:hypothetical protein CPAST_c36060 [Clostridium pasteurianum DSM 525 = ATCC 6013]|uniref:Integral membrane protein CcmA involved in cell shape determination n=1 Tax=Clostridium pasteurianum DSM 525 = ATCC 6013 TaxID=1262449 RepID=A0A0H3J8V6_CLOPA|nr:polymer-forming cytoskeletal protein [Clostridium pasteurianum]AJA49662.1 hypothetical protein CPAST_c36060 [Clostridium pasteurianum DSM 525 = ATCC 6013]AJA53650.1 hypothetical protein CLPA_c36060 [Clostridium pasteurianum DSM 525 = ATCC 6013]AOZ76813.1 cell shape determination protein CcmA [Clostridium pasteurianum DSM 525 = ATCC 6013]AOZ80610.1 cell shape determination protein CcmA [Clostridium pasteurianum]ELP58823.1 hypothetical protein F502_11881 [Clostridium pasteurianum DSM 525 = AT